MLITCFINWMIIEIIKGIFQISIALVVRSHIATILEIGSAESVINFASLVRFSSPLGDLSDLFVFHLRDFMLEKQALQGWVERSRSFACLNLAPTSWPCDYVSYSMAIQLAINIDVVMSSRILTALLQRPLSPSGNFTRALEQSLETNSWHHALR